MQEYGRLTFSIITRYEILRGLEAKEASAQLARFHAFCVASEVLPIDDAVIARAAQVYGMLHRAGTLIGDTDILISATALTRDLVLVTNNERHLRCVTGLRIENWRRA